MKGKFTHYLITRFNVPVKNWERDKSGRKVLDEAWMQERLNLFRTYCAPTISRQSSDAFTWLIYCDTQTSPVHLEAIRAAVANMPHVIIRQVEDFDRLLVDLRTIVAKVPTPYVITSRLDNDDGLGPQFIYEAQSHFVPHHLMILNFRKGVLYDTHRKVLTEIRQSHFNHYGSLIEEVHPDKPLLTILGYPHGIPPEESQVIDIDSRFAWLKIIHERNMASKTNGKPISNSAVAAHFQIQPNDFRQSWLATGAFVFRRLLYRLKRRIFPK